MLPLASNMAADGRTIAPGPKRMREAYLAGLRPYTPWITCGMSCLALAFFVHSFGAKLVERWSSWLAGTFQGSQDFFSLGYLWLGILMSAFLFVLLGAWICGNFGVVHRNRRKALGHVPYTQDGLSSLVIAIAVACILIWSFLGVIAGAARSVDASPVAINMLWRTWLVRVLSVCGWSFLLATALHLWLAKRRLWLGLHQTPAEFRAGWQGRSKA